MKIKIILSLAAGVILAILISEIILQILDLPSRPRSGWTNCRIKNPGECNYLGFRGREIYYTDDDFVVLIVGDSEMYARHLPFNKMPERRLAHILKKFKKKVKVFTIADMGYGQDQQFLALKKYFMNHRADLVLLMFTVRDDLINNIFPTSGGKDSIKPTFYFKDNKLQGPLDMWLEQLASIPAEELTKFDSASQMAFWINAYNGITLRSVIDAYPVKSIKDIDGVWKGKKWMVAGLQLTLDNIEHNILRPVYKDPRVHFAVNCASIGCPPLYSAPFHGKSIDSQLNEVTARFINHPMRNLIDYENYVITTTEIFSWFKEDFVLVKQQTAGDADVINFIATYLDSNEVEKFSNVKNWEILYLPYDWSLNDIQK